MVRRRLPPRNRLGQFKKRKRNPSVRRTVRRSAWTIFRYGRAARNKFLRHESRRRVRRSR